MYKKYVYKTQEGVFMSRYRGPRVKIVRRLGPLPGLTTKRRKLTEQNKLQDKKQKKSQYRIRLEEKQKLRFHYGLTERQLLRYIRIARKAKGKESWFLGSITDENSRKTAIKLDFLTKGKKYKAIIYEDAKDADWQKNPIAYKIRTIEVTSQSKINLNLAPGGGTAISFEPIN